MMDYLKTDAPFWKKEYTADGERWVAQRDSDQAAAFLRAFTAWSVPPVLC